MSSPEPNPPKDEDTDSPDRGTVGFGTMAKAPAAAAAEAVGEPIDKRESKVLRSSPEAEEDKGDLNIVKKRR